MPADSYVSTPAPASSARLPNDLIEALAALIGPANVRRAERVGRYTTWRVGGPAALLCVAGSAELLRRTVELVRAAGFRFIVVGRGSNLLVDDAGIDGVVIVNRATSLLIESATVRAESGVLLSVLARQTVAAGLVGLEWCHDIPGSVGGAVVSNAGANGGAMADVVRSVRVLTVEGAVRELDAPELHFGYRHSILRAESMVPAAARPVVLEARFALRSGQVGAVKEAMSAQRARRKATQPGGASAGSVFKNPPGDSAGRLVESVGLKGAHSGDAQVSTLHANFVVTGPRATARDVLSLISLMRGRVRAERGVELEPEVQYVRQDLAIGPPPWEDA